MCVRKVPEVPKTSQESTEVYPEGASGCSGCQNPRGGRGDVCHPNVDDAKAAAKTPESAGSPRFVQPHRWVQALLESIAFISRRSTVVPRSIIFRLPAAMQDIFAPGFGRDPTILPGARHFRVPEFEMGYHEGMLNRPRPAGVPRIPFAEFADNKARHSSIKRSPTWLYCWLAAYAVCLILLLTRLSLWLDEILDLMGARIQSFPELISYVRSNAGAVPLGYLAQAAAIRAFGLSAFSGRLPSALASLAGCAGVYFLARRTAVRRPLLAAVAFAICPIQFRYALEARDYALALALSIYATLLFSFLRGRPRSIGLQILY